MYGASSCIYKWPNYCYKLDQINVGLKASKSGITHEKEVSPKISLNMTYST